MSKRIDSDDSFSPDSGDLGLGRGLKPGALPKEDSDSDTEFPYPNRTVIRVEKLYNHKGSPPKNSQGKFMSLSKKGDDMKAQDGSNATLSRAATFSEKLKRFRKARSMDEGAHATTVYTELPIGTSVRQHRQLFERELTDIIQHKGFNEEQCIKGSGSHVDGYSTTKLDHKSLGRKLNQTQEEVELLKQDLELCQMQLKAKYQAIKILQSQSFAVQNKQTSANKVSKVMNLSLQKEVNRLQFEIEKQGGQYSDNSAVWAERFDKSCQENMALMATLEVRSGEMKKQHAEKMALIRERDELLVLLDLQERQRYEALRTPSMDDDLPYNDFSAQDLATLGACHCRKHDPEPCACAHKAVYLKRDMARLQDEVLHEKQLKEEALITGDVYRMAFEEQLARSQSIFKKLAEVSSINSDNPKAKRKSSENPHAAKAMFRWMLDQLNDDMPPVAPEFDNANGPHSGHCEASDQCNGSLSGVLSGMPSCTDKELINMLVDMINDKSEALAHQRLAARMLAKKNHELEERVSTLSEEVFMPSASNGIHDNHIAQLPLKQT